MQKMIFTCDHCGKELNEMHDYADIAVDNFKSYFTTDLCSACFNELSDIILQYIGKKEDI